jgi:predicted DNA-binding protein
MKEETITIRISTEVKQKLERMSQELGITKSQIIRPLIEEKASEMDTVYL